LGKITDHTRRIGSFGDVFDVLGLDTIAIFSLKSLATTIMLVSPSQVTGRANVDEGYFVGIFGCAAGRSFFATTGE